MRHKIATVARAILVGISVSERVHADCQGGPVFPENILLLDRNNLAWSTPADIAFVKGNIANLPTYRAWVRGVQTQATSLDASNDQPAPGEGVFYLVKLSGPPCGSWQTAPGAEPSRDVLIQSPCGEVAPSNQELQAAVDAGLAVAPNPWGLPGDAKLYYEAVQDSLGCAFEVFEDGATSIAQSSPPQWNPSQFWCGLDDERVWAVELPAGPCLNSACFTHDTCYFEHCVGGLCAFSPQTISTNCDGPLILDACAESGCLQSDGWGWYFSNKLICMTAEALTLSQTANPLCQDPPCSNAGEVCDAATATCGSAGCADASREGFVDLASYPNVAACAGFWSGRIDGPSAGALCAPDWHVCDPAGNANDAQLLGQITHAAATEFSGCFPYNAAHDYGQCLPCTGAYGYDDMGGTGAGCAYQNPGYNTSCLADQRIDADCCSAYATDHACAQNTPSPYTGVVCCRDL